MSATPSGATTTARTDDPLSGGVGPRTVRTATPAWTVLRAVLVAGAYIALGAAGVAAPFPGTHVAVVWLPAGIALVALLRWGDAMAAGIAAGTLVVELGLGAPPWIAAWVAVGNTAGPWLGARLLRRARVDAALARRRDLALFVAFGVLLPFLISSLNGSIALAVGGLHDTGRWSIAWLAWFFADAVGVLNVAVPLLALGSRDAASGTAPGDRRRLFETLPVAGAALALGAVLFFGDLPVPLGLAMTLALLLPITWVALRAGLAPAAWLSSALSLTLLFATVRGAGPFRPLQLDAAIWLAWQCATLPMLVAMLVAALTGEQSTAQALWRLAFERSQDGLLLGRPDGSLLDLNATARTLLAAPPGHPPRHRNELFDMTDPRATALLAQLNSTGAVSGRIWLRRMDDTRFEAQVAVTRFRTPDGALAGYIAFRDVTELARRDAALRESEHRFRTLADTAPVLIWMEDVEGRCTFVNARWQELTGEPAQTLLGLGWRRLVHPDDLAQFDPSPGRTTVPHAPHTSEYRLRRHDGQWRDMLDIGAPRFVDGEFAGVVGSSIDITDRKAAERALQTSEERLRLALAAGRMGTWEYDPTTQRSRWDARDHELLGLPLDREPSRAEFLQVVHPDDRDRVRAALEATTVSADDVDIEFRVLQPGGGVRWLAGKGRVMRTPEGTSRVLGVNFDVTHRHERDAAVLAAAAAREASEAKSQFLSRMSHELRTPLNAVLGFAQLLALDAGRPLDRTQHHHVAHIRKAGEHLLEMINEVLDLSMIETGRLPLHPVGVRLAAVVDEAIGLVGPDAAAAGIRVGSTVADTGADLMVRADPIRLRQALVNLLVNSIKYNRANGTVRVESAATDTVVHVHVADTGIGMDAAQCACLFEPFNRLGRERTPVPGTGIGLVLTRRLVEAMGGSIAVVSTPGVGSCFTLTLARSDSGTAPQVPAMAAPIGLRTTGFARSEPG